MEKAQEIKDLEQGNIIFHTKGENEILKLCSNGDILVKGKLVENDLEVVDALREFLKSIK